MQRRSFTLSLLSGGGLLVTGCGGGGGADESAAPAPPPAPPGGGGDAALNTYIYVARPDTSDVSVHQLLTSGALKSVGAALAEAGVRSVAIHASGRFAYAVNRETKTISIYDRHLTTGALTFRRSLAVPGFSLEDFRLHPLGRKAYASRGNGLQTLSVDIDTGDLQLGNATGLISLDCFGLHPSRAFLFLIDDVGRLASYKVEADDSLTEVNSQEIEGRHVPMQVAAVPSGKFLYVSFRAAGVTVHGIDLDTGAITAELPIGFDPGSGPFAIHPSGLFAYAFGEEEVDEETFLQGIFVLDINPDTGALSRRSFHSTDFPVEFLTISPSGRLLYSVNDEGASVSGFSIDPTSGALTSLGSAADVGGRAATVTLFDSEE